MSFNAGKSPALQKAISYLSRFSRSERQVRAYLARKEFVEPEINEAVAYLREKGYLNDSVYAESVVREHIRRCDGPRKIRQSLMLKGIESSVQDRVLRDLYPAELQVEAAVAFLRKKLGRSDRDKAMRSAASRGFSYDIVRQALHFLESPP